MNNPMVILERIRVLEELISHARPGSPDLSRWLREIRDLRERLAA